MTWISPTNFNLAAVTGSYGGMGFNPLSSWDPNASGNQAMSSPFFAQLQQYVMRVISGIVILIMVCGDLATAPFPFFFSLRDTGSYLGFRHAPMLLRSTPLIGFL
jgi:hypothetical protein